MVRRYSMRVGTFRTWDFKSVWMIAKRLLITNCKEIVIIRGEHTWNHETRTARIIWNEHNDKIYPGEFRRPTAPKEKTLKEKLKEVDETKQRKQKQEEFE